MLFIIKIAINLSPRRADNGYMERCSTKFDGSNDSIIALHKGSTFDSNATDHKGCIDFEIELDGKPLNFTISYGDRQAKLSDLVPAARQLCTEIINAATQNESDHGRQVTCGKGCASCCSYLVSLSSAEAFRIKDEIFAMPVQKRQSFMRSMINGAKYILDHTMPEKLPGEKNDRISEENSTDDISAWYGNLNLTCPFLTNKSCDIYDIRPLVCREHLVTTEAPACKYTAPSIPRVVEMPVSIASVLMQTSDKLDNTLQEAIILPLAMLWAEENIERSKRTWPGETITRAFVETILETISLENREAANSLPIIEPPQSSGQPLLEHAENNY